MSRISPHKSFMALAITLLLIIGQAALASHVVGDALLGLDDNCELCHQFDRQPTVLASPDDALQLEPNRAPAHFRDSGRLTDAVPASPNARGPPLS